jgi:hypothetical protein
MSGNYKIWMVMGFYLTVLTSGVSADPRDLATVAREVFKGGKPYTESEIASVRSRSDIPEYQRTILEVQMLGSVEEKARYERAVEISTEYIDSGSIPWVRDFLRMQRGFTFNLLGEREKGASDLKFLIDNQKSSDIAAASDVLLSIMKERNADLDLYFDSVMRQSLGFYFLDFHKEAPLLNGAYQYFSGIRADLLKDKCLEQLKKRIGEKTYLELRATMDNKNSEKHTSADLINDIPRSQDADFGQAREVVRGSKNRRIEEPHKTQQEIPKAAKDESILGWRLIAIIVFIIAASLVWRWKSKATH